MAMPRRRPFADVNQYYVYVWKLDDEVIWVGQGRGLRAVPTRSAGGRGGESLRIVMMTRWRDVTWEVEACETKEQSLNRERELIQDLRPKYNKAPGFGGWKGMHSPKGLEQLKENGRNNKGRKMSAEFCERRSEIMRGNQNLLGHKHSDETKAKISAKSKGRPVSDEVREKRRQVMLDRYARGEGPRRKTYIVSEETKKKISEAAKRRHGGANPEGGK